VKLGWRKAFNEPIFDDSSLIDILMTSNLCLLASAIDILQRWGTISESKQKAASDIQLKT